MKTAKEKAMELVDKFVVYSYFSDGNNSMNRQYQQEDNAKQCALICVDEILQELENGDDGQTSIPYVYWQEVKQELNKQD
jgi:hypothetical protein